MSPSTDNFQSAIAGRGRKRRSNDFFSSRASDGDSDDESPSPKSGSPSVDDDRRAHHNELERRRRDHIKDHFMSLKDAIPLLEGEKSSRALILKRAVEYIALMQSRLNENQMNLDELRKRNETLEAQLKERMALHVEPSNEAQQRLSTLSLAGFMPASGMPSVSFAGTSSSPIGIASSLHSAALPSLGSVTAVSQAAATVSVAAISSPLTSQPPIYPSLQLPTDPLPKQQVDLLRGTDTLSLIAQALLQNKFDYPESQTQLLNTLRERQLAAVAGTVQF